MSKEKSELDSGDKIEFTPEEELERAAWELNLAQTAYFKALKRRTEALALKLRNEKQENE